MARQLKRLVGPCYYSLVGKFRFHCVVYLHCTPQGSRSQTQACEERDVRPKSLRGTFCTSPSEGDGVSVSLKGTSTVVRKQASISLPRTHTHTIKRYNALHLKTISAPFDQKVWWLRKGALWVASRWTNPAASSGLRGCASKTRE